MADYRPHRLVPLQLRHVTEDVLAMDSRRQLFVGSEDITRFFVLGFLGRIPPDHAAGNQSKESECREHSHDDAGNSTG